MLYSFILLAAGKGIRFGKSTPKQFLHLAGRPMIVHTLERVDQLQDVSEIVVVCNKEYKETIASYVNTYGIKKPVIFANGGATRQESVYHGLLAAGNERVILHEAARPLVSLNEFKELIECPHDNATISYQIPFTVLKKDGENRISDILEREELVNIQLPQKFVKEPLLVCHRQAIKEGRVFTEDASMVKYYLDEPVYCLPGSASNIKITEYTDLLFAEILFREKFLEKSIL